MLLPRRRANSDEPITFARLLADVDRLALALLQRGIRRGDRVGILAENRYEWLLIDQALASIGAPSVPRGSDTSLPEMAFILEHSGCRFVLTEDDATAREVLAMRERLPGLEGVAVMADSTAIDGALALGELLQEGEAALADGANELQAARDAVVPEDLLTIVYTSGTTANPKGVMLTHDNVLANVRDTTEALHITGDDVFLSVLPAWHMYERIMDYLALAAGGQLVYTDRRNIKTDLASVKPTVFAAVPRIWEMLHDGVVNQSRKLEGLGGKLLRRALDTSRLVGGRRAGLGDKLTHAVLRRIVLSKVLAAFGGRLRLCVSGGGALPRHVDETLLGMGLPLLNGYGLTETSPVAAVRRAENNDPGHIGPPLPNTRIEPRRGDGSACAVGETGVLWIAGPQIMRGYYNNPERTAEVLQAGWFCSGDLGHVDAAGHVWITGRAKDTIVLAGGENVEPEPLETLLKTSPLIEQAVVLGQDQKSLGALLVPNLELLEHEVPRTAWDEQGGALRSEAVRKALRAELDRVMTREQGCRACERIAAFRVVGEPMTPENELLTRTLKVKRHVVAERYRDLIDELFA
ncbi:MAG: long-chain fatty acid--CoA ligase [Planctomycetes bacterium]|nr:long-chain fatty acid--CoA ligase [Planctomycetota bacterium]